MRQPWKDMIPVEWVAARQKEQMLGQLEATAAARNWALALAVVGWLHLGVFVSCHYLSSVRDYHYPPVFAALWAAELMGVAAAFRLCGGRRGPKPAIQPIERLVRRIWGAYFVLAVSVTMLNGTAGHTHFVLLPAIASLASFAFIMMTVLVTWRFFGAVLVMFASGLLMAAHPHYAYVIFGVAWWFVLERIAMMLWQNRRRQRGGLRRPIVIETRHDRATVTST